MGIPIDFVTFILSQKRTNDKNFFYFFRQNAHFSPFLPLQRHFYLPVRSAAFQIADSSLHKVPIKRDVVLVRIQVREGVFGKVVPRDLPPRKIVVERLATARGGRIDQGKNPVVCAVQFP